MWLSCCVNTVCWKSHSFPHPLDCLVKNQLSINVRIYFSNLTSVSLIFLSVLMHVPRCLNYFCSLVNFKLGNCESSSSILLLSKLWVSWVLKGNWINLPVYAKKPAVILMEFALNLKIILQSVLVFQGCQSQIGWLKQQKRIWGQFWRIEIQDQGVAMFYFYWGSFLMHGCVLISSSFKIRTPVILD